jgi:spore maturation protein CgeB
LSGAKTIVNFAADRTNGLMAMKGRVIEALMAGAILLEQRNEWTRQFLTPGGDYFEWDTLADIKRILENLRNDPVEAERIRQNSLTRARFYTARRFWNNVERLVK